MVVKQKFRRMGIAKRLVITAVDFCKAHGYDQIELITTDIHSAAKCLYELVGFECASHRQHKYFRGYLKVWMYEYVYHFNTHKQDDSQCSRKESAQYKYGPGQLYGSHEGGENEDKKDEYMYHCLKQDGDSQCSKGQSAQLCNTRHKEVSPSNEEESVLRGYESH